MASMSESFPDLPLLKTLRLAKPSDILRIGIVATASFRYSPVFRWERPYHEKFPQATLLAYRKEFTNALKNEQSVVLVVDDSFIPNESDFTEAIIPADNGWSAPATGDKVVVGAMSFKFEPGSLRQGQFSFNDAYMDLPLNEGRDLNKAQYDFFGETCEEVEKRYLSAFSQIDMLCVHPAYWRRGHGTRLVKWTLELAKLDSVTQGVNAAYLGSKLYEALGYEYICTVDVEGDQDDPEGISTDVYKFSL